MCVTKSHMFKKNECIVSFYNHDSINKYDLHLYTKLLQPHVFVCNLKKESAMYQEKNPEADTCYSENQDS